MRKTEMPIPCAVPRIEASTDATHDVPRYLAWAVALLPILTVSLLTACTGSVPDVLGSVDTVKVAIFKSGAVENEAEMSTEAEPVAALRRWLSANRRGWVRDERTYAPGILLSTERFSINLVRGKIIVVSEHEEYVRDLSAEEYAALSVPFLR